MTDESLEQRIHELAERPGAYPEDAYGFVHQVVLETVMRQNNARHVTALEVLEQFKVAVARDFGEWGDAVLGEWGVNTPEAVGKIVFSLVEAGLLSTQESDSVQDFQLPGVILYQSPVHAAGPMQWEGESID